MHPLLEQCSDRRSSNFLGARGDSPNQLIGRPPFIRTRWPNQLDNQSKSSVKINFDSKKLFKLNVTKMVFTYLLSALIGFYRLEKSCHIIDMLHYEYHQHQLTLFHPHFQSFSCRLFIIQIILGSGWRGERERGVGKRGRLISRVINTVVMINMIRIRLYCSSNLNCLRQNTQINI